MYQDSGSRCCITFLRVNNVSWLRWASLLVVGLAAIMWAGIAVTSATGPESSERAAIDRAENLSHAFQTAAKRVLPALVVIRHPTGHRRSAASKATIILQGKVLRMRPMKGILTGRIPNLNLGLPRA